MRVHLHAVVVGDQRRSDRGDPPVFHRPLQLAADLCRLDGAAEEAHDRPLDDPLEELLEAIKSRHVSPPERHRGTNPQRRSAAV